MDRMKAGGYAASIEASFAVIPPRLHELIRTDFLCGSDPVLAGLHRFEATLDGRSYRSTSHCTYVYHQEHRPRASRATTVVLPVVEPVPVIVHELGHVLHERLRFEPSARPVSWYAETNGHEAFAEAFAAWVLPAEQGYQQERNLLLAQDQSMVALLDQLAFA